MHLVAPTFASVSVTVPAAHAPHAADSARLYKPAEQLMQEDAEPALSLAARFVPAAQLLQNTWPSTSWNLPGSQSVQSLALKAPTAVVYFPTTHFVHVVLPESVWYWPGEQL